jgi:glutamyl-tRNA(Gln) amidotransferase subunit E
MDADEFTTMKYQDVTDIFQGRELEAFNKWFKGPVTNEDGLDIKAVLIPGFKELLSHPTHSDQTFSDELAGRLRVISCLDRMPNLITSDDVPFGGLNENDLDKISKRLNATEMDGFVIVPGPEEDTLSGVKEVYIRCKEAFYGIPNETRQVTDPGTTSFERILPGPDRMYPDTDRPPIVVTKEILDRVNAQVPVPWWEQEEDLKNAGVPDAVAHKIVISRWSQIFEDALKAGADKRMSAIFIMEELKKLNRRGLDVDSVSDIIPEILSLHKRGAIARNAIPKLLWELSSSKKDAKDLINSLSLEPLSGVRLEEAVNDIIKDNPDLLERFRDGKVDPLMGVIMDSIGDRVEGSKVIEIVQ